MPTATVQRLWDPHTDLLERFAAAGAAPLAAPGSHYVRLCCTSPCHGLAQDYVDLWHEIFDAALAVHDRSREPFDAGPVIDAFRRQATEARRRAGEPDPDRFGDSRADRSLSMVLHTKAREGGGERRDASLTCWSRGCDRRDVLAGIGLVAESYLHQQQDWYRPSAVPRLGPVPRVALRNDLDGDFLTRPPNATLAAFAEAKRLPLAYLRQFAEDDPERGGIKFFYRNTRNQFIGIKKRLYLSGKNNFLWFGRRTDHGRAEIAAWHEGALAQGRARGRFDRDVLVVVEGESDWLTLNYHGIQAIALPGATTGRTLEAHHLDRVVSVYISRENDSGAGESFLRGVGRRLVALGFDGTARALVMPDGLKDPSDLHVADPAGFAANFRTALEAARLVDLGAVAAEVLAEADRGVATGATPKDRRVSRRPSRDWQGGQRASVASAPRAVGWLSDENLSLADRGAQALAAPVDARSEGERIRAEASRESAVNASVTLLGRELEKLAEQPSSGETIDTSRAAAVEFAHRALAWMGRQTAAAFWVDVAGRPTRLIVAAIERDKGLREFAGVSGVAIPFVRQALDLAVLEGPPASLDWALTLRWEAFTRLQSYIRERAAGNPSLALEIQQLGEVVKQTLRRENQAAFWITSRQLDGPGLVDHACKVSASIAEARAQLASAHAKNRQACEASSKPSDVTPGQGLA